MGFERLTNEHPRAVRRATVRVRTRRMRFGQWKLNVTIPMPMVEELFGAEASRVEALLGRGEDAGRLLIVPVLDGEFKLARLQHGCLTVLSGKWPEAAFGPTEVSSQVVNHPSATGKALLLTLPEWAIDPDRAHAIVAARAENVAAAAGGPDFEGAPSGTRQVWKAVLAACAAGQSRSTRATMTGLAKLAKVDGARVINAVAWLSQKGWLQRVHGSRAGEPDIFTPTVAA